MGNVAGAVVGFAVAGPVGFVAGGLLGTGVEVHKMNQTGRQVISPMRLRRKEVRAVIEGEDLYVHIESYIPQYLRNRGCNEVVIRKISEELIEIAGTIASVGHKEFYTQGTYFWAGLQVVDIQHASRGLSVAARAIKYCIVLIDYEVEGAVICNETFRFLISNKQEFIRQQPSFTAQMYQELDETARRRARSHLTALK
jgi:hypothetical protein